MIPPACGLSIASRVLSFFAAGSARSARSPFPGLTEREREILDLVARCLTDAAIAQRLVLSSKTVRNHVWRLAPLGRGERSVWLSRPSRELSTPTTRDTRLQRPLRPAGHLNLTTHSEKTWRLLKARTSPDAKRCPCFQESPPGTPSTTGLPVT